MVIAEHTRRIEREKELVGALVGRVAYLGRRGLRLGGGR